MKFRWAGLLRVLLSLTVGVSGSYRTDDSASASNLTTSASRRKIAFGRDPARMDACIVSTARCFFVSSPLLMRCLVG
jgi:hypothetical protein